jgi:hypothetical protein
MATSSFAIYRSEQPELPLSFEYPSDWHVERSQGSSEAYAQVQVYGPESLEGRLRTYIVVRVIPPQADGGRYASVGEMAEDYRKTLLPTLRIEQDRELTVLESPAHVLDVSGTVLLPWKSPNAQSVPVKSQRVFFEKGARLYELAWMATPEVAPAVEAAFSHLLQTLTILE